MKKSPALPCLNTRLSCYAKCGTAVSATARSIEYFLELHYVTTPAVINFFFHYVTP